MFELADTGVTDRHGNKIFEGDSIGLYPDTRRVIEVAEHPGVYEIEGEERPEKFVDNLIYRGVVRYSPPSFYVKLDEVSDTGVCSVHSWAYGYAIEKIHPLSNP